MSSAAALKSLREAHPNVPFVGMEPAVKPAAEHTHTGVVGVLATTRTLHSDRFQRLVGNHANHVRVVAQACPGLADTIDPDDRIFESQGVKIVVSTKNLPYLEGMEVDYAKQGLNEGFRFNNPNAKEMCGCGESFSV